MLDLYPDRVELAQEVYAYKQYILQNLIITALAAMTAWRKAIGAWTFEDSPGGATCSGMLAAYTCTNPRKKSCPQTHQIFLPRSLALLLACLMHIAQSRNHTSLRLEFWAVYECTHQL